MSATAKKSLLSQPIGFDVDGPRAKRANATNAYLDCPCCSKRFLMTELEEHVNRCLLKQGGMPSPPQKKAVGRTPTKGAKTNIAKNKVKPHKRPRRAQRSPSATIDAPAASVPAMDRRRSAATSALRATIPPPRLPPAADEVRIQPESMVGKRTVLVEPKFGQLVEAATFRPTLEEFKDPLAYIQSIHVIAHDQGIAKIIPPVPPHEWLDGEVFQKVVKSDTFYFQTKVQDVGGLSHRGTPQAFIEIVNHYRSKLSLPPFTKCREVAGKRLRMNRLFDTVSAAGGSAVVDRDDAWKEVAAQLNFPVFPANVEAIKAVYDEVIRPVEHMIPAALSHQAASSAQPSPGMRAVDAPSKANQSSASNQAATGHQATGVHPAEVKEGLSYEGMAPGEGPIVVDDDEDDDLPTELLAEEDPFGFIMGRVYNLHGFTQQSTKFFRKWFNLPPGTPLDEVLLEEIESEFWSIVNDSERRCRVLYGSDLDVNSHGSGFSENAKTPWNLRTLAWHAKSLLRHLPEPISGITVPMIYVGMLFSAFCWHTEDTHLYSINYLHTGHPKVWYGVGSTFAEIFEATMKKCLPELFKDDPGLLFHLVTMLSPLELQRHGVPVVRAVQNAGEFIVTFPRAYHAGFNAGFNVAEAVNFACSDWLPYADVCPTQYSFLRSMVFSHQELAYIAFSNSQDPKELDALFPALLAYARTERHRRHVLVTQGLQLACRWETKSNQLNSKPCHACMNECYFSAVVCPCNPEKIACLNVSHVLSMCSCPFSSRVLLERKKVAELTDLITSSLNRYLPGTVG